MTDKTQHGAGAPSAWIAAQMDRLESLQTGGRVLDIASGAGRHARLVRDRGHDVLAVDRNAEALAALAGEAGIKTLVCDLESGAPWPFADERFKAVIVANYLYRPALARTIGLVAPGGLLIYETFGTGNERFGKPSNPDFLARPHEIADAARAQGFTVELDEHRTVDCPTPAVRHRVLAARGL